MKGYFLIGYKSVSDGTTGIGKKIVTQIKAMNSEGLICESHFQESGREHLPTLIGKLLYILPFTNVSPKWKYNEKFGNADFIYFRRPIFMSAAMRRFLKKCKQENPKLKVFVEIPTFPYDLEYNIGLFQKFLLIKDKFNRTKLNSLVDCFLVIDPMNMAGNLYGIKTKRFINGYDVRNTEIRLYKEHESIVLACVAMFGFWHGYERLFYGLSQYYRTGGKRDIVIELVGEGSELSFYKKTVSDLSLNNHVNFHGKLFGKELDAIYSRTDIGIGCLGCFKKGINIISDLKTREYFAKGIPVISGCTVDIFSEGETFDFYREVPNELTPVNVNEVVDFYDYIMEKRKSVNIENAIHTYSLRKFDISSTIKAITNTIKEELK